MVCNDTHTHCHSCWCKLFEWIRIEWIRTGGIRVEDTYWWDMYWWDTFAIPADAHLLNGYALNGSVLVGYVLNGFVLVGYVLVGYVLQNLLMQTFWMDTHCMDTYWWDTCWTDTYWWDTYWWDTFWMDMCGICVVWWICVGYVWCEICVGYVWCEIRQQSSEEPCDETSFGKNAPVNHKHAHKHRKHVRGVHVPYAQYLHPFKNFRTPLVENMMTAFQVFFLKRNNHGLDHWSPELQPIQPLEPSLTFSYSCQLTWNCQSLNPKYHVVLFDLKITPNITFTSQKYHHRTCWKFPKSGIRCHRAEPPKKHGEETTLKYPPIT